MESGQHEQQSGGLKDLELAPIIIFGVVILAISWGVAYPLDIPGLILPEQGSAQAARTDGLFRVLLFLGTFVFLLVQGLLYYAAVRFRAKPNDMSDGPNIHGNTLLEIVWTIIPSIVVVILAILSFSVWTQNTASAGAENENVVNGEAIAINAIGQRYQWSFEYMTNEENTAGEPIAFSDANLRVYIGQNVKLDMTTQDVIHSFWVPAMRVKQDLLPGRVTEVRFTPIETDTGWEFVSIAGTVNIYAEPDAESDVLRTFVQEDARPALPASYATADPMDTDGDWVEVQLRRDVTGFINADDITGRHNEYRLICTELCGGGHGQMYTSLLVYEDEEAMLDSWYDVQVTERLEPPSDPIARGAQILAAEYGCGGCHVLDAFPSWNGIVGPNQNGLGNRADDRAAAISGVETGAEYIAQSIRYPNDYLVPGYAGAMPAFPPEQMSQEDLNAIVAYLCVQTANPADPGSSECGLENWSFDEDLNFTGDVEGLVEELTAITDEYED